MWKWWIKNQKFRFYSVLIRVLRLRTIKMCEVFRSGFLPLDGATGKLKAWPIRLINTPDSHQLPLLALTLLSGLTQSWGSCTMCLLVSISTGHVCVFLMPMNLFWVFYVWFSVCFSIFAWTVLHLDFILRLDYIYISLLSGLFLGQLDSMKLRSMTHTSACHQHQVHSQWGGDALTVSHWMKIDVKLSHSDRKSHSELNPSLPSLNTVLHQSK